MRPGVCSPDELGVSPVIGVIMILAISVVGIAATVAWGLPAIDEMKSTVEARAVTNQFKELDQDVKQLVSGTAEKTAKRWQPSLTRGSIDFMSGTQRWALGYATCTQGAGTSCDDASEHSWTLAEVGDTDNEFVLKNEGSTAVTVLLEAAIQNNGQTALRVNVDDDLTQMAAGVAIPSGGTQRFYVFNGAGTADQDLSTASSSLQGAVFEITITDFVEDEEAGRFFVYDSGEVRFRLDSTGALKTAHLTNGAVLVGNAGNEVVDNTPGIPPPKATPDGWTFFARGVSLQGAASFAGEDRFDVLLSLYGTNALADEDSVAELYVMVGGDHEAAWTAYFSESNGYDFTVETDAGSDITAFKQRIEVSG